MLYPSIGTYCFVIILITSCATTPPRNAAVLGRSAVGARALQTQKTHQQPAIASTREPQSGNDVQFAYGVVQVLVLQLYTRRQEGLSFGGECLKRRCKFGLVGRLGLEVLGVERRECGEGEVDAELLGRDLGVLSCRILSVKQSKIRARRNSTHSRQPYPSRSSPTSSPSTA